MDMNMPRKGFKNDRGFTLIELLVVVAIIGILATVVIASVTSARKRGRDARRTRDLQEIRSAIELYISQNGVAPDMGIPSCLDPQGGDRDCIANETNFLLNWNTLETQLAPYISKLSKDPCGIKCFGQPDTKYDGYFTYTYQAPSTLSYLNDVVGPGTTTSSTYTIFAQNIEARNNTSLGFGPGSF